MAFSRNEIFKEVCERHDLTAEVIAEKLYFPLAVVEGWFSGVKKIETMDWIHLTQHFPDQFRGATELAVRAEIKRRREEK